MTADWRRLLEYVMSVPERIYETWEPSGGWNNITPFGEQYGENGVSWCVIFDWDAYASVGLAGIVPKTDNVTTFSNWAKARGQWSEYPSVGAWVNFNDGAHTEIVIGFDATYVYTKGGNSIEAGAVDNGQGNGVWSHRHERRDDAVVGYFAPHFLDGLCPPTADPHDPRGADAVTSYRWTPEPTATEDDVTPQDIQRIADAVYKRLITHDGDYPAPPDAADYATNKKWTLKSWLTSGLTAARATHPLVVKLGADVAAIKKKVGA